MKRAIAYTGLALSLHGCLNLNLKQILPKITTYDLNAAQVAPQKCPQTKSISLVGILSADLLNTKEVVFKNAQGEIHYEKHQQFVDLPKNMLKTMVILQAFKECVFVSLPPHSALPHATLKLNILSFGILDQGDHQQAEIVLGYDISTPQGTQTYLIAKHEKVSPQSAKGEGEKSEGVMRALQHVSQQAIQEVVAQIKKTL
ncbi:ABC-type transport auxiliary lipoprotein family protein [Helicobacter bizzozeronii]|uniref:ABC-type transport auxiliary lipoprotein family protein n=1 Tax=Helicobacter bizzozeronii TaxID=56877 RepID=UPI000CEDC0CA|nr:ABC-type transport auxiliary lipoprotein family protein [Helicobacter bizzozeronii]